MTNLIGFMQGRLSPLVNGKIQAFPRCTWEEEFVQARSLGIPLMEWTLDQLDISENPLMTAAGRERILELSRRYSLHVSSVTGDCFMQAPFWKAAGAERAQLHKQFKDIVSACGHLGVRIIVVPLVDEGRLETNHQERDLVSFLLQCEALLVEHNVQVAFESDFEPGRLAQFIEQFPRESFGINYDMGNSASLGFDPRQEIRSYGTWIRNVHVKDRVYGGSTVPLGEGDTEFNSIFEELSLISYQGNFILQTARAADDDHMGAISSYYGMTEKWLKKYYN